MANPSKQGLKRQKLLDLDLKVLKEEKTGGSPQKKACFSSSKLQLPVQMANPAKQGLKQYRSCCSSEILG